jgi:ABC-type multidrug transport system fused ATPase/permease subunit
VRYVLRHYSARAKHRALAAVGCMVIATALDTLVTWVLGRIVGVIVSAGQRLWHEVGREMLLLVALWTVRNVAYRVREWLERLYVPELLNTTRSLLFARLIQQSHAFLHANFAGVLANHVRRAAEVMGSMHDKLMHHVVPLLVRFCTAGILLWSIEPAFALFIPAFIAAAGLSGLLTAPRWAALSARQAEKASQLSGAIVDSVTNLSIVHQNAGWREELRRLEIAQDELTRVSDERRVYTSWFFGAFDAVMTVFFCGFIGLVVYGWQRGGVTTAELAMTVGLATSLFFALAATFQLFASQLDDIGVLQDALRKISAPFSVMDRPGAPDLEVSEGAIELRGVGFRHAGARPLFSGLSLRIPPGQKVGLVGTSGAGKTTLCELLLRSYDLEQGGIFIDGQNIAEVTQASLRRAIAVIPQDPVLFHRSLLENIGYPRPGATLTQVRAVAKDAEADAFVGALQDGYRTLVGERGVKLSGGQRQRVAIARAMIKDAPILVLDEATSALDSETEAAIQGAMMRAMQGRTTIVIAHRLSTISKMDRILVMEDGRIVQDGTFDELRASDGTFARLWGLQSGGFIPEAIPPEAPMARST